MISYKRLFKLMIDREIKKTELAEKANITRQTLSRMVKDQVVSLEAIDRICAVLDCQPGDILEFIPEKAAE